MKFYLTGADAIYDLHNRGFTNDFQLFGNNLLWVQQGLFIKAGEFAIVEYHKVTRSKNSMQETIVFGIIALHYNIKGILLNHHKSYSNNTPPILVKKLGEMSAYSDFAAND